MEKRNGLEEGEAEERIAFLEAVKTQIGDALPPNVKPGQWESLQQTWGQGMSLTESARNFGMSARGILSSNKVTAKRLLDALPPDVRERFQRFGKPHQTRGRKR